MNFVMNRSKTVATKMGHAIQFVKGEPTHVPKEAWPDVIAAGAISEDEIDEEDLLTKDKEVEMTAEQREAAIFAVYEAIVAENDRDSFTGNGLPNVDKVSSLAGFTVKADERTATWTAFRQSKETE